MNGKRCVFMLMAVLITLSYVTVLSAKAQVDGFRSKLIKFDGKVTKGKLDSSGNLIFIGRGTWNAPLQIRFSPFVRVYFELVPFIETESHGILGEHTITFTFVPKARGASHQNLRFTITNRGGDEIISNGVAAPNGSGWAIGLATEREPFEIHVSYSSERSRDLTPVESEQDNS
ncbi:MAG: hypothetical protein LJE87_04450 [Deltaproteobacteria bacterium]|nr:hypothetical protein [Deltaproteobacteria bacterium]